MLISYECEELIDELERDISEFGGDLIVEVVTEESHGVTIYKDYNFLPDPDFPDGNSFILDMTERVKKIRADELLKIYKKQDSVL